MTLLSFIRFPLRCITGVFMLPDELLAWVRPVAILSPLTHVIGLFRFGFSGRSCFHSPWMPFLVALVSLTVSWLLAEPSVRRSANR
jgi:ABC-type polysaccharide/polyol phosphate export permease